MSGKPQHFSIALRNYFEDHGRLPDLGNLTVRPSVVAEMLGISVRKVRGVDGAIVGSADESPYQGRFTAFMDGAHREASMHEIEIVSGLERRVRTWVLWHEIAHAFDFTEFANDRSAWRTVVDFDRYSDRLAPLLKRNVDLLCLDELPSCWGRVLHIYFGPSRPVWVENSQFARASGTRDTVKESPKELFAEALALAVLDPAASYLLDSELHEALTAIVRSELSTIFPAAIIASVVNPMENAEAAARRQLQRSCVFFAHAQAA